MELNNRAMVYIWNVYALSLASKCRAEEPFSEIMENNYQSVWTSFLQSVTLYCTRPEVSNLSRLADLREREGEAFYACARTHTHKRGRERARCK